MQGKKIIKVGAIILNEAGKLLAVHKKGKPELELIVPGGKVEAGESDEQALCRELLEELNVLVHSHSFYAQFEAKAIYEDAWLVMRTYIVKIRNHPKPSGEIDKLVWLDRNYNHSVYQFASILGKQILPKVFYKEGQGGVSTSIVMNSK